jgi:lipid A 3-O-deacylase
VLQRVVSLIEIGTLRLFPVIVTVTVLAPQRGTAQLVDISTWVDNDYFNFWLPAEERPDRDYTHGTHVQLRFAGSILPGKRASCHRPTPGSTCFISVTLGQHIYTPRVDARDPVPGERPYAGWLFVQAIQTWQRNREVHSLGITVGVTGRPSLAEVVQVGFHRLAGFRELLGWHHQLGFEPGVILSYQYRRRLFELGRGGPPVVAGAVSGTGEIGSVRTSAGCAARVQIGVDVPNVAGSTFHSKWSLFLTGELVVPS